MFRLGTRRMMTLVAAIFVATVLGACGNDDGPLTWDAQSLQSTVEDLPFIPSVINSSIGVGESRVVVALIDRADGALVSDATVTGTFYRLADNPETEPQTAEAHAEDVSMTARVMDLDFRAAPPGGARAIEPSSGGSRGTGGEHRISFAAPEASDPARIAHVSDDHSLTTVYTSTVTFDQFGYWGVDLQISVGGEKYRAGVKFWVMEQQGEVAMGAPAPRSEQLTLRDVDDPADISSATEPNPAMLEKTVAEALDTGRPVVVAFVTPAFCQTRFCGPVMESVVQPAWERYGDRVEFVHIEPFDLGPARTQGTLEPVPAVVEWGLRTEPFIFVIDDEGRVNAKIEGVTDLAELSEAIEAVLN